MAINFSTYLFSYFFPYIFTSSKTFSHIWASSWLSAVLVCYVSTWIYIYISKQLTQHCPGMLYKYLDIYIYIYKQAVDSALSRNAISRQLSFIPRQIISHWLDIFCDSKPNSSFPGQCSAKQGLCNLLKVCKVRRNGFCKISRTDF